MLIRRMASVGKAIISLQKLGGGPMPTNDPFLFAVYHKDQYPPGNPKLEAPRVGNGQDFNPDAPYRMYHGDRVPGFPQHPHRGFETITATIDGLIDHADSLGNAGRYGQGDVQWMTAGAGVCHSEMFPLVQQDQDNPTRFFQIWLNLPAASKMADPGFAMFWAPQVPRTNVSGKENDGNSGAQVTVWCGTNYFGIERNNAPPPASWASNLDNDVAIWHITVPPGSSMVLPAAHKGKAVNRSLFYIEGAAETTRVCGQELPTKVVVELAADQEVELENTAAPGDSNPPNAEFLLLQGVPISEPVAQHGPFVMNTQAEIRQAFADYQRTKFGGWPWERDDPVFGKRDRFAKLNGVESTPPAALDPEYDACAAK